jgi:hypothetical protein
MPNIFTIVPTLTLFYVRSVIYFVTLRENLMFVWPKMKKTVFSINLKLRRPNRNMW